MNIYISDDIRYLNNIINIENEIINGSLIVIVAPFFSNYLVDYSFLKSLNISFENQIVYLAPGYLTRFISLNNNNLKIRTYSFGPKDTSDIINWIKEYHKSESIVQKINIQPFYKYTFKNFDYNKLNDFNYNTSICKENISKNSPKEIIFTSLIDINKIPKNNLKEYLKNSNLLVIIYDLFDITVQDYNTFINDTLSYLKKIIISQEQILLFQNGIVGKTLDNYSLNFGWDSSDLNSFIYSTVTFLKTKGYKIKDIHNYFSNSKESRKLFVNF